MGNNTEITALAKALLNLSWSDMDDFSETIHALTEGFIGERGGDIRLISASLTDWANELLEPDNG